MPRIMRGKSKKRTGRLKKILLAPIRILAKARDFYVKSMEDSAARVVYGGVMGLPTAQVTSLPRSFTMNSSHGICDDDRKFKELVRHVMPKRNLESRTIHDYEKSTKNSRDMKRSYSVGLGKIGTIEEDKPCSFREEEDCGTLNSGLLHQRSRSYAARKNSTLHYKN
ncbi:uncharacterized protein LOC110810487 [Carica papaya]|uniref:uncharacterized protein LOC110810487 n=1 Tax=Carica papaya TaxID=3649 RepID=UPI000B8CD800|nr:uncharacterized protein LOC110810487 [Carica papaya]